MVRWLADGLDRPRRGPLVVATVLGAIGVAGLPLVIAFTDRLVVFYVCLVGALAVAAVGEALGLRWLRWAGMVVTVAAAVSPVVGLGQLLVLMVVFGPLGAVIAVGAALRLRDPSAGTAFLAAAAMTITAAFVATPLSVPLALALTAVLLAGGTATTLRRLP